MTETLLQKIEEKMMLVLAALESSRKRVQDLEQENAVLKFDKENHSHKLQELVSLLDAMDLVGNATIQNLDVPLAKPMLVQG